MLQSDGTIWLLNTYATMRSDGFLEAPYINAGVAFMINNVNIKSSFIINI